MTRSRPLSYRALALGVHRIARTLQEEVRNPFRLIIGYTTREHLILDLDKTHSLQATKLLILMVQREYPEVGSALLAESSHDGYHVIFNNRLSWNRILHICKTLTGLNVLNKNYIKIRNFREDLTLRISSIDRGMEKSEAPRPLMIISPMMFEEEFSGINEYLEVLCYSE